MASRPIGRGLSPFDPHALTALPTDLSKDATLKQLANSSPTSPLSLWTSSHRGKATWSHLNRPRGALAKGANGVALDLLGDLVEELNLLLLCVTRFCVAKKFEKKKR